MYDLSSELLITQAPSTLSDLIELCISTLSSLFDKHAPLITKPLSSRPSNPWFTPYLHELKATRRPLKKLGNARAILTMLCAFESSPTSIITPSSKLKHLSRFLIAANKLQSKRLWQTVNT